MVIFSLLHTVLFAVMFETSVGSVESLFGEERKDFDGKITTDFLIENISADSAVSCAARCMSVSSCVSIFFVADQKRCQLHSSVVKSDRAQTTRLKGSKYYVLMFGSMYNYTYDATFNMWYKLGKEEGKTWLEHRDICLTERGNLMSIRNENMRLSVVNIIVNTPGGPDITIWHIDGTDAANEGTWLDKEGQAAFVTWGGGQPSNSKFKPDGQNCLALDRNRGYRMNDLSCYWNYYARTNYICGMSF